MIHNNFNKKEFTFKKKILNITIYPEAIQTRNLEFNLNILNNVQELPLSHPKKVIMLDQQIS